MGVKELKTDTFSTSQISFNNEQILNYYGYVLQLPRECW